MTAAHNQFVPLSQTVIDVLFDVDDPSGSEARLRSAATEHEDGDRAELETLIARTLGLQERFAEGHTALDAISVSGMVVQARIELERGRLLRSAGDSAASVPHFERAIELARATGHTFLELDAMHMLALVRPERADDIVTAALVAAAKTDDARTKRWTVALHNNLGWALHDAKSYDAALVQFRLALEAAESFGTAQQVRWAKEAIAECLASMDV
jgi:tetratricopeptide (TPR) repeat protein